MSTRQQALRDIFAQPPSKDAWLSLCNHLGTDTLEPWELDYAKQHLAHWPDDLKIAPEHWNQALVKKAKLHAWPLIHAVECHNYSPGQITKLLKHPRMVHITSLSFIYGKLATKTALTALTTSPHLASVRALALRGCILGDEGFAQILHSDLAKQLHTLHFEAAPCTNPRALGHTPASFTALKEAEHLTGLRHLTLGGTYLNSVSKQHFTSLGEAPHLQSLHSITFDMFFGSPSHFLEAHSLDKIDTINLVQANLYDPTFFDKLQHTSLRKLTIPFSLQDTFLRFCQTPMPSTLDTLSLELQNNYYAPYLPKLQTARWATQLRHLAIQTYFKENDIQLLTQDTNLGNLQSLHLRTDDHSNVITTPSIQSLLQTQAYPHLESLTVDIPFKVSQEECDQALAPLYKEHRHSPPYPAWDDFIHTLQTQAEIRFPTDTLTMPVQQALVDLKVPIGHPERLEEMFNAGAFTHCKQLRIEDNLKTLPVALIKSIFSTANFNHLIRINVFQLSSYRSTPQLRAVINGLANNPNTANLQTFHYDTCFDTDFVPALVDILTSPHLPQAIRDSFDMRDHVKRDADIKALCKCKQSNQLQHISLASEDFTNHTARALAASENLSSLQTLELSKTKISDVGAKALARSRSLGTLEKLSLNQSRITSKGAQLLADAPHLSAKVKRQWATNTKRLLKKESKR